MITESTIAVEKKFQDVLRVESFLNIIMATNNDWQNDMTPSERRFVILRTDDKYAGPLTTVKNAYMGAIRAVEPWAVAHFLYTRDVSDFDPRQLPPLSEDAQMQIIMSMKPLQQWWLACLDEGHYVPDDSVNLTFRPGMSREKSFIYEKFSNWARSQGIRHFPPSPVFWKDWKTLVSRCYEETPTHPRKIIIKATIEDLKEAWKRGIHQPRWQF